MSLPLLCQEVEESSGGTDSPRQEETKDGVFGAGFGRTGGRKQTSTE